MNFVNDPLLQECIRLCENRRAECDDSLSRYASAYDAPYNEGSRIERIQLMKHCIDVCHLALSLLKYSSDSRARTCSICAEICDSCVHSCEAVGGDDILAYLYTCRYCADACRQMCSRATMVH